MLIHIIGAGGTGQFILAALANYTHLRLKIQDKDFFEASNEPRQWASRVAKLTGTNSKADVMARITPGAIPVNHWYEGESLQDGGSFPECVIASVDNHRTRQLLKTRCDEEEIPLILPGNADSWGQCFTYDPWLINHIGETLGRKHADAINPWIIDPTLNEDNGVHPGEAERGEGCDSSRVLDETPQFALANMQAAVLAVKHALYYIEGTKSNRYCPIYSKFNDKGSTVMSVRQLTEKIPTETEQ